MIKISIATDFRKKNSGISASTPRADTVETSDHNGAQMKRPAPPHYDEIISPPCGDSSAGAHQAVRDTRWRPYSQNIHRRRFPKKQQDLRSHVLDYVKKPRNFCAHATRQLRRNEWVQCTPRSSLPRKTVKPPCGDSSAGVRQAVGDIL